MVKSILKWGDAKFEEALNQEGTRGLAVSVGVGAIEGAIDSLVVLGALAVVCNVISAIKK